MQADWIERQELQKANLGMDNQVEWVSSNKKRIPSQYKIALLACPLSVLYPVCQNGPGHLELWMKGKCAHATVYVHRERRSGVRREKAGGG